MFPAADPWMPPYPTLAERLWSAEAAPPLVRGGMLVGLGTLLLIVSAWANVPFWPVPLSLQASVVLFLAALYGPRLASLTLGAYLLQAALGFPVLAGSPERGLGVDLMLGPTGGFLAGYVMATLVVGGLVRQGWDRSLLGALGLMGGGMLLIQLAGLARLMMFLGPLEAWHVGLAPFLPTLVVQVLALGSVFPIVWWALTRRRRLI